MHKLDSENQEGVMVDGVQRWLPAIAHPLYVTQGLPIWKRPFEKYWRPKCECGRLFETLEDFRAHYFYMAYYGQGHTKNVRVTGA